MTAEGWLRVVQVALTVLRRGRAASVLGTRTVSTPFGRRGVHAPTAAASAEPGATGLVTARRPR